MIRMEITADTAEELYEQINALAWKLYGTAPGDESDAETKPKTRRQTKKAEAKAEPKPDPTPDPTPEAPVEETAAATEPEQTPEAPEAPAEEPAAGVKEDPKPAEPAAEKLTMETVRAKVVNDYLNVCFEKQDERVAAFNKLTAEFGVKKFKDIPDDKLAEVDARVDALIAEGAQK